MKSLLIDNYDSFVYNIVQLLGSMGYQVEVVKNDDLESINIENYHKIIISPGPGNPTNSSDRGSILEILQNIGDKKVLGICFGHQLLANVHGADIFTMSKQMHGEIDTMIHGNSILYNGVPERFTAIRYHSLSINPSKNIIVDCRSESDGSVMGFHTIDDKFFGVQFHPESFYSEYGTTIMKNFMEA
jgi:anthranilate synthase component 2